MLTLTRKANESIIMTNGETVITLWVTEIRGNSVRLSVEAPQTVKIRRDNAKKPEPQESETSYE